MFDVDRALKLALDNEINQRQDSLTDQLQDLLVVANKMKMYDAADYLQNAISR